MSSKRKLKRPTEEVRLERFREQNRNRLIRDLEEGRWFRPDSTLPVSSVPELMEAIEAGRVIDLYDLTQYAEEDAGLPEYDPEYEDPPGGFS